ncbi:MAG: beta-ketoacyl-[acyl-carrier-protein] synthase [Chloroflexota bacterium]
MRRVVVTGCGTVNPLGLTVRESWENCCNGVSGVGRITLFDTTQYLVKIACEVKNFDPSRYMEPAEARRRDRCQQFSTAAANCPFWLGCHGSERRAHCRDDELGDWRTDQP